MKVWAVPITGKAGACFVWSAVAERNGDTAFWRVQPPPPAIICNHGLKSSARFWSAAAPCRFFTAVPATQSGRDLPHSKTLARRPTTFWHDAGPGYF